MADLRDELGLAGYGALWVLLERIPEAWDGSNVPCLRLPVREWRSLCGFSAQKFQILLKILNEHDLIHSENEGTRLRLTAPIMLNLQDEWTGRQRKNSGATPELPPSHSGTETGRRGFKFKVQHPVLGYWRLLKKLHRVS